MIWKRLIFSTQLAPKVLYYLGWWTCIYSKNGNSKAGILSISKHWIKTYQKKISGWKWDGRWQPKTVCVCVWSRNKNWKRPILRNEMGLHWTVKSPLLRQIFKRIVRSDNFVGPSLWCYTDTRDPLFYLNLAWASCHHGHLYTWALEGQKLRAQILFHSLGVPWKLESELWHVTLPELCSHRKAGRSHSQTLK